MKNHFLIAITQIIPCGIPLAGRKHDTPVPVIEGEW
jgi:hypothetical protein